MTIDYSAGKKAELPNEDELSTIAELAEQQVKLEQQINAAEETVKDLKASYLQMRTETLPEAMKQVGLSEFTLSNGAKISVKDDLNCNIKAANKFSAFAWLRARGHGDIIKNDVLFSFGTGEDEAKQEAIDYAEEKDLPYSIKEAIHAGTLNAWAKKQLELDDPEQAIPEEIISVFRFSVAKVTLPKKAKAKKK